MGALFGIMGNVKLSVSLKKVDVDACLFVQSKFILYNSFKLKSINTFMYDMHVDNQVLAWIVYFFSKNTFFWKTKKRFFLKNKKKHILKKNKKNTFFWKTKKHIFFWNFLNLLFLPFFFSFFPFFEFGLELCFCRTCLSKHWLHVQ